MLLYILGYCGKIASTNKCVFVLWSTDEVARCSKETTFTTCPQGLREWLGLRPYGEPYVLAGWSRRGDRTHQEEICGDGHPDYEAGRPVCRSHITV